MGTLDDLATVPSRLARLRASAGVDDVFGFHGHRFELRVPLADDHLESLESRWGVTLPADYRFFLTKIGDGGAGPGYGLFPVGQCGDSATETEPWDEWMVSDLRTSFRLSEPWNLPDAQLVPPDLGDEGMERWFEHKDTVYFDLALINGTIPIAHQGCAYWDRLVVSGPLAGQVWTDGRAGDEGIRPASPVRFTEWYLHWLDACEASLTP
ncbi:SMI1/KNR4 family protein [Dermatophilaceae bacterium Soc4.6]